MCVLCHVCNVCVRLTLRACITKRRQQHKNNKKQKNKKQRSKSTQQIKAKSSQHEQIQTETKAQTDKCLKSTMQCMLYVCMYEINVMFVRTSYVVQMREQKTHKSKARALEHMSSSSSSNREKNKNTKKKKKKKKKVPEVGLEPTTTSLRGWRSTD